MVVAFVGQVLALIMVSLCQIALMVVAFAGQDLAPIMVSSCQIALKEPTRSGRLSNDSWLYPAAR
jgi:hypothetical protein